MELDSRNHILLEHEPAWQRFQEAVLAFVPAVEPSTASAFAALSARERQVLALMADVGAIASPAPAAERFVDLQYLQAAGIQ